MLHPLVQGDSPYLPVARCSIRQYLIGTSETIFGQEVNDIRVIAPNSKVSHTALNGNSKLFHFYEDLE